MLTFYIFSVMLTLLFFVWFFKKPCLKWIEVIDASKPQHTPIYCTNLVPLGLKIWSFLLLVLLALIPIVNLIGVVLGIVLLITYKLDQQVSWEEIFPNKTSWLYKIIQWLKKDL